MTTVPTVRLAPGVDVPQLGFGVWQVPADEAQQAVTTALEAGYRHVDTAAALRAFDASLDRLGLDVLDLYLVHWPLPSRDLYVETWRALVELQQQGRVRAIGVSNFTEQHLQRLFDETGAVPAINQVELHPYLPQDRLRAFHAAHGVVTQAWSPIGQGGELLAEPVLAQLAEQTGTSPAQVVLRWHLQLGNVVIPKSVTPERIRSNIDVFGFTLTPEQMDQVSALGRGRRLGPDPDTFDVA